MTYDDFSRKIENEYERYENEELRKTPKQILDDSFLSYCMYEIKAFFCESEYISDGDGIIDAAEYFWIHNPGVCFIWEFYNHCSGYEDNPCNSWGQLNEAADDYEREYKMNMERNKCRYVF